LSNKQGRRIPVWIVAAILAAGQCSWFLSQRGQVAARANASQEVPYKILHDDNGDVISIGVEAEVSEQQLRAALVRAANEHQDDRGRDYFFPGLYLWVKAYLLRDGHQGSITAGTLRRFVPLANLAERYNMKVDRARFDDFAVTLDAKRSLHDANEVATSYPAEYDILGDDIERLIVIGVDASVDGQQLRALLVKAANEHQDDDNGARGRTLKVRIEAFVVKDGRRSSIPAGRIERIIAVANPEERKRMKFDWTKFDKLEITLDEAKRTLQ
jgi:hypothetical protein